MLTSRLVAVAAVLFAVVPTLAQPPTVPRLTERQLDRASYVELARQWKEYIAERGETAEALVNLGMAHDYSEEHEAALIAARRAVQLAPDYPRALGFLGKMLATIEEDEEAALEVLLHCREVAPDYEPGLNTLCAVYMRRGDLREANEVMRTVFEQRLISRPLQDYAYNMLVGLPEGAVVITSGDSDTFPPLGLQAGMDFRPDVIIINRSLLNLPAYANGIFDRHPGIRPAYNIEEHVVTRDADGNPTLLATTLLRKMMEEQKAPLYFNASAVGSYHGMEPEGHMEGINLRTGKQGMSPDESARLFLETYRLDSATDWSFHWALLPSVAHMLVNYESAMVTLVREGGVSKEMTGRLLELAEDIAEFHEHDRMVMVIRSLRKE